MKTKQVVLDGISRELDRTIVVLGFDPLEKPNAVSEQRRKIRQTADEVILQDLRFIVSDERVGETASVESERGDRQKDDGKTEFLSLCFSAADSRPAVVLPFR